MAKQIIATLFFAVLLGACSDGGDSTVAGAADNPFSGFTSAVYGGTDNWLCHPLLADADNVCAGDLDSTRVFADGSTEIETHVRAVDPAVDCFYVYPTVSFDEGGNADLEEGPEEIFTTLNQAARYSQFCRVFAPVYRQITLNAIFSDVEVDRELAFGDVVDSFKHFIANENNGRGFVLIGHSQGAGHLRRLVQEVVETDEYLLQRLVSAHLIGSSVRIPDGADVGADFQQVPVCRNSTQTGCVVSFATYREGDPFLAAGAGRFGLPRDDSSAICSNPAALAGGQSSLSAHFPVSSNPGIDAVIIKRANGPFADEINAAPVTTPFYSMPGFIKGECTVDDNGVSYLQASALGDPTDPRADDFNGEFIGGDGWGLHLVDMTLTMGDLVALGAQQAEAWLQN